jgi:two-component system sensor kinase FixL
MNELVTSDKFTALIDAAVDGIFVINSDGIIEVANRAVERMLGYQQSEMLGQNIKFFMPSPYREKHDGYLSKHLKTGSTSIIGIGREVPAQRKDGSILQIYLSVGKYGDDSAVRFVGIARDLSDLKKSESELVEKQATLKSAEQEIHELVNRLAQVSRIGVMGEMAASIAHEINQPLTAISSYAQACGRILTANPGKTEDVVATLGKISEQAIRAGNIIRGLRSWVRDQDTVRISSNCNVLLSEVVDIAKMEAQNGDIQLELSLDSKAPMVMCDPVQIQQVALNLVKNAIDSLSECSLERADPRRTVSITIEHQEQDRVRISVSDLGPGISDDVAENLFNPFFTTKESGMGMGLSISQTIIRAHGGELDYQANPQGGVEFFFILPTSVEPT